MSIHRSPEFATVHNDHRVQRWCHNSIKIRLNQAQLLQNQALFARIGVEWSNRRLFPRKPDHSTVPEYGWSVYNPNFYLLSGMRSMSRVNSSHVAISYAYCCL